MADSKAGIKTSEFWVTLIQALVGPIVMILVAAGVFIPETNQAEVTSAVNSNMDVVVQAVLAVVAQIGSVLAVGKYTKARTELKSSTNTGESK